MAVTFDISPEKEAGTLRFLRSQLCITPPLITRQEADLTGRTAIVTGASGGLGLECARQLLDLGCKVVLAVRNEHKGELARQTLSQQSGIQSTDIEVWGLDLGSYDSVMSFAERAKGLDRLDIAILNAAIYKGEESFNSTTGYEEDIQTNYLSNALLLLLLAPTMKEKKVGNTPGRIVLVSSDLAAMAKFNERESELILPRFKQKMTPKWAFQERYATSKLLGQILVTELAKRIPSSAVVITTTNPGLCRGSDLARDGEGHLEGYLFKIFFRTLGRPCPIGARVYVHAAVSPVLGDSVHGQYVEDAVLRPMAPLIYKPEGEQVASKLWNETMEELSFAGVREIVAELSR